MALFARSLSGGGGAERVVVNLAGALAERGHNVDLVLARTKGHFLKALSPAVRLIELRAPPALCVLPSLVRLPGGASTLLPPAFLPGVAQVLGAIPALARYLRRERPDAILSALEYANVAALVAKHMAGVPVRTVVSVHNHLSSSVAHADRPHLLWVPRLVRRYYRDADAVVTVSRGLAQDVAQMAGLAQERLETIYNPVLTPEVDALARAPLDHRWFVPGAPPVLLGAGKLKAQKDFPTLIRAFARVRAQRPARLIILGEGPRRRALLSLARQLGVAEDVELPGFQPNPYAYMARAAVFVLSSAWEGFGNVLVEAMACGLPTVSTDCPSGPAEILQDGRYGRLVPVGDSTALADAIVQTLEHAPDPARLQRHAGQFTAAASAARYERVLVPCDNDAIGTDSWEPSRLPLADQTG